MCNSSLIIQKIFYLPLVSGQDIFPNNYLHKTVVDSWVFKNGHEPTVHEFVEVLEKVGIEYEDTGILLLVTSGKTKKFRYIRKESEIEPGDKLNKEDSGFLVLKSGVEVFIRWKCHNTSCFWNGWDK